MDKVFLEENEHLLKTLNTLEQKIYYLELHKPFPKTSKYAVGYDKDERDNLMYQKVRNKKTEEEISYYNEFRSSPYFARMDFNINKSYEKVYIGKKSLTIDRHQIVYDWRSEVGKRYYLKNEIIFIHNQYVYELLLRRALDIKNGTLLSYSNEYSIDDEETKGEISDPFLIRILNEKRQEYRLTDIIRTIQQNQNEIINYPKEKSFIVQGCAGSGKTMIMLHRLSYLKFNYPELDLTRVKILTPNEGFTTFINELSIELELEKIQRVTVEDYYLYLLSQYNSNLSKEYSKLIKDTSLNKAFIKEIYSSRFVINCEESYKKYIEEFYSIVDDNRISNIIKLDIKKNMFKYNDRESIKAFSIYLENLIKENKENKIKLDKIKSDLTRLEEYRDVLKNSLSSNGDINVLESDLNIMEFIEQNSKYKESLYLSADDYTNLKEIKMQLKRTSFFSIFERNKLRTHIKLIENKSKSNKSIYESQAKQSVPENYETSEVENIASYLNEVDTTVDSNVSKMNTSKLRYQEQTISKEKSELDKLSKKMLDDKTVEVLQEVINNIKSNFNDGMIFQNTFGKTLSELARKYNINYFNNIYRHNIYLYLQFYSKFASKVARSDFFINIDEGQDISISEYKLLKNINGEKTVFNIYGDINQLINSKGIVRWSEIEIIDKIFELKENYRNTIEITNFCNNELGYDTVPIGLTGAKVQFLTLEGLLNHINNYITKIPKARCAVIVSESEEVFFKDYLGYGRILNGQLSVLTIEESKGMEFDFVAVYDKNMLRNEKYIAYTRALNELMIIR